MDDYDKILMDTCNWKQLGGNVDQQVESTKCSGTASEAAGSGTGVPTRTSPEAPLLSVMPPSGNVPILVYASTQQILTKKFDFRE